MRRLNDVEPIPESLLCPIGYTLMADPIICADSHSYDRLVIEEWLRLQNTSPYNLYEMRKIVTSCLRRAL
jgi:hypothetical protein